MIVLSFFYKDRYLFLFVAVCFNASHFRSCRHGPRLLCVAPLDPHHFTPSRKFTNHAAKKPISRSVEKKHCLDHQVFKNPYYNEKPLEMDKRRATKYRKGLGKEHDLYPAVNSPLIHAVIHQELRIHAFTH